MSTPYQDFTWIASADFADKFYTLPSVMLDELWIDSKRYTLAKIDISNYHAVMPNGENFECAIISYTCIDTERSTSDKPHIVKFTKSITDFSDILRLFKQFSIELTHRDADHVADEASETIDL